MKKFGSYDDVYHANDAMDKWCRNCGGCDSCPYALIADLTDISCGLFWVWEHCFIDSQNKCEKTAHPKNCTPSNHEEFFKGQLPVKVIQALHELIELQTGRLNGETDSEYRIRQANVINNADLVLGEVEEKFSQKR